MRTPASFVLLATATVLSAFCRADTLFLSDGTELDGTVVEEKGDQIVFRTSGGTVQTYKKSQIESIVKDKKTEAPKPPPPAAPVVENKPVDVKPVETQPIVSQPRQAPPTDENASVTAAKAAFAQIQEAFKARKYDDVLKLISRNGVTEQQHEQALNMVAMLQNVTFNESEFDGETVTLSQKTQAGNASSSVSITMVYEGGQWKLGREPSADEDPRPLPAAMPTLSAKIVPQEASPSNFGNEKLQMSIELTPESGKILDIEFFRGEVTECKDDTGKLLGKKTSEEMYGTAGISTAQRKDNDTETRIIGFRAHELPAAGAKSVSLKGNVQVVHGTELKSEQLNIKLKKGTKLTLAGMPLMMKNVEESTTFGKPVYKYIFTYRSRRKFSHEIFQDVKVTDSNGRTIEAEIRAGSSWRSADSGGGSVEIRLKEKTSEITLNYKVWADAETKVIPVEFTVPYKAK